MVKLEYFFYLRTVNTPKQEIVIPRLELGRQLLSSVVDVVSMFVVSLRCFSRGLLFLMNTGKKNELEKSPN